jgi:hypothetical protein
MQYRLSALPAEGPNSRRSKNAIVKSAMVFLREVRLLIAAVPMAAYAIISLWEHFGL